MSLWPVVGYKPLQIVIGVNTVEGCLEFSQLIFVIASIAEVCMTTRQMRVTSES